MILVFFKNSEAYLFSIKFLKYFFGEKAAFLFIHNPILAFLPFLSVGIIHAKNPGAIFLPTNIYTKSGSRFVSTISAPIPLRYSVGSGKANLSLIFE